MSKSSILFAHSLWGLPEGPTIRQGLIDNCLRLRDAGYDAVEVACFLPESDSFDDIADASDQSGLQLIAQVHSKRDPSIDPQVACELQDQLWDQSSERLPTPLIINSHSGSDAAPDAWNDHIISHLNRLSTDFNIPLSHETHRGRATWNPRDCIALLKRHSNMKLCADFSHWCCVHESLLDLFESELIEACKRSIMIHSGVGFAEGPQISHWRAPEHQAALERHLSWWDQIVDFHQGSERPLVITTEFGPRGYMPTLPFTNQPIADMWEINSSFRTYLAERYCSAK